MSAGVVGGQGVYERLFAVEGYAEVRRIAEERLAAEGPDPAQYRWLGLGHMAEDEDDHDAAAETAFRRGLELAPDDIDLIAAYAELCLRADGFDYPGRAKRAPQLVARLEELAAGSPQDQHVQDVLAWHRRGYFADFRLRTVEAMGRRAQVDQQSADLDAALNARRADRAVSADLQPSLDLSPTTVPERHREAVTAATLEELSGKADAPARFLARNRAGAWVVATGLSFATNRLLRTFGVVDGISLWGFLWFVPLLLLDRRLAAARARARRAVIARVVAEGPGPSGEGSGESVSAD
ncbi:tetratricopeptide repeat protein [Streptomyces beihaiensis]|uniref:Tetratricopeptide repeat protein n=1 Tax=Streptomyces beihaiensis TaxID=2984495 RepID=A0ABT3TQ58_9ACTN|nr:hypothetical protein [Streptomyces beihaiensis]MCX3059151.1 hypothetical protein [Streptomyces beihaiensis]